MHLFAIFRGRKDNVDRTINDLNGKFVSFHHGTAGDGVLNIMANPVQLVDIIFPKEHLSMIVNTLGGEKSLQGQESVGYLQKYVKWFRKLAHLKPIENIDEKALALPINKENLEIIGLGIKEDRILPDGTEGI